MNGIKFGREALLGYRTSCKLRKKGLDICKFFFFYSIFSIYIYFYILITFDDIILDSK